MTNIKKWEDNDNWVEVDLDLCARAAECVNACPSEVFRLLDGKVAAENIGECAQCLACQGSCPANAILNHSTWE